MGRLDKVDLTPRLSRKQEAKRLEAAWTRLQLLRLSLGGHLDGNVGPAVCVVFEGWDAAGKGGCIRRLVQPIDPRHVSVMQYAAPSSREKRHHFLWRFWPNLPGDGGMCVFDRSWYGRVLVERVEGFCPPEAWERGYQEIHDFERSLAGEGMIIVKFWLHISPEEQMRRFERRARDPLKSWKLTDEDWRNRERRVEYEAAVEDMLERTDQPDAPWHVISAENKRHARVEVSRTVIAEIERGMRRAGHEPPLRYPQMLKAHDPLAFVPDAVAERWAGDG